MSPTDAVAALRSLTGLAEGRRRNLIMQATLARDDDQRRRIVYVARAEHAQIEDAARDELARRWDRAQRPAEARQTHPERPQRVYKSDYTLPPPKPITTRYVKPSKPLAKPRRREGISAPPLPQVEPEPKPVRMVDGIDHGLRGYNFHRCRCSTCSEAKRQSRKPKGRVRRASGADAPHGSLTRYKTCKCDECRAAATDHARQYRARRNRPNGSSD